MRTTLVNRCSFHGLAPPLKPAAPSPQATSYVENTTELRRVLRAFASVSKKDEELRELSVDANDNDDGERPRRGGEVGGAKEAKGMLGGGLGGVPSSSQRAGQGARRTATSTSSQNSTTSDPGTGTEA